MYRAALVTVLAISPLGASGGTNAKPAKLPSESVPMSGSTASKALTARLDKVKNMKTVPVRDAKTYFLDYNANEVAADSQYKGKPFILVGKVSEISKSAFGSVYLAFHGDRYGAKAIHATLFNEQICGTVASNMICSVEEKAGQVKKGQMIELDCIGDGMMMRIPMAAECLIRIQN